MNSTRIYSFETCDFERTIAHDGMGEVLTRRVLSAADGSSCNFIDLTIVEPGVSIGIHTHSNDNEEMYVIVAGFGEMSVEGETFPVSAGHVISNYPGGTHGLYNSGNVDLKLVVIEVPVVVNVEST